MNYEMTENLTYREKQIISFVKNGYTNQQIAANLCTSLEVVKKNLSRLFEKTGCTNRTQLAIKALQNFQTQNVA